MNSSPEQPVCCYSCGAKLGESARFCFRCGREQDLLKGVPEEVLIVYAGEGAKSAVSGCVVRGLKIGGACFLLLIFVGFLLPPRRRHHGSSREKACYANMRVLLGAIEMYNMDNTEMVDVLDGELMDRLVAGQYLKRKMSYPTPQCRYGSLGHLTGDGTIVCSSHGTVESN